MGLDAITNFDKMRSFGHAVKNVCSTDSLSYMLVGVILLSRHVYVDSVNDCSEWQRSMNFKQQFVKSRPLENRCEIAFYPYTSSLPPPDDSYKIPRIVHVSEGAICQFCDLQLSTGKALTEHKRQLHPTTLLACPVPSCRLVHNQKIEENEKHSRNSDHYICKDVDGLLRHYAEKHCCVDTRVSCPMQGCTKGPFGKDKIGRHFLKDHKDQEEKYKSAERLYVKHGTRHAFKPMDRKHKIGRVRTDRGPLRRPFQCAKATDLKKKRKSVQGTKDATHRKSAKLQ